MGLVEDVLSAWEFMEDVQEDVRFPWEFMEDVQTFKKIKIFLISCKFSNVFHETMGKTYVFLDVFHEFPREMHIFHPVPLVPCLTGGDGRFCRR